MGSSVLKYKDPFVQEKEVAAELAQPQCDLKVRRRPLRLPCAASCFATWHLYQMSHQHRNSHASGTSTSSTPVSGTPGVPRTIAELGRLAQDFEYDGRRTLKDLLQEASALKKRGEQLDRDGQLEDAFLNLARAANMVVDKLPRHPSYRDLTPQQASNLKLVCH